jgi:putative transposase
LNPVQSASWLTRRAMSGAFRSDVRVGSPWSTRAPTITSLVAPGQAGLEQCIREICHTRVRYGYWRVHVLLRREGWSINQKKTKRVYRELGLQLRNQIPKRRVKAKLHEDRKVATQPNETWATNFVHDQLATGARSSIHSLACHQRWKHGSPFAALTS